MSMKRLSKRVACAKTRKALIKRHRRYQRIATRHERRVDARTNKPRSREGYPFV